MPLHSLIWGDSALKSGLVVYWERLTLRTMTCTAGLDIVNVWSFSMHFLFNYRRMVVGRRMMFRIREE